MKSLLIVITGLSCLMAGCSNNSPDTAKTDTDSVATAMSSSKTDQVEKNKQTALDAVQGVISHNPSDVFKNATPDIADYGDGIMPPVKGLDSCKAFFQIFLAAFPDIKGENLMAISEGNHVAVFGDWSGTFKGDMMGIKATGKSFKMKDVDLFTFNDEGKITEHRAKQTADYMLSLVGAKMKK